MPIEATKEAAFEKIAGILPLSSDKIKMETHYAADLAPTVNAVNKLKDFLSAVERGDKEDARIKFGEAIEIIDKHQDSLSLNNYAAALREFRTANDNFDEFLDYLAKRKAQKAELEKVKSDEKRKSLFKWLRKTI
ncbi:MAG: hypothetical protein QW530_02440 [Candidatus Micrarchaeaceae archaeon]